MNLRTTYFLFAAVLVVLVVFVLVLSLGPRGDADDYLFASLRPEKAKSDEIADLKKTIQRVEIERNQPSGDTLAFEKEGTTWVLAKPYRAKIESAAIERVVGALIDARLEKKLPPVSLADAGLDSPSAAITLVKDGKPHRVALGNMTIGSGGRVYAVSADKPKKPIAFRRASIDEILIASAENAGTAGEALKPISDYRPRNFLADGSPIPWDTVQKVTLKEGVKELVLQKDPAGGWHFLKPGDYGAADPEGDPSGPSADNIAGVKPLLSRVASLAMPAAADILEGEDNFAKYGVAEGKESLRIEFGRTSGSGEALLIGAKADDKGEKVYARLNGERCVVKLDAKALEPIRKVIAAPNALRDRTLTALPPSEIDAIDIKMSGAKPIELRRLDAQWRIFEGGDASELANSVVVQQLIGVLTQRRNIVDFPDSAAGDKVRGLDPPAVEIALWRDGVIKEEKKEEKKEDKPAQPKEEKKPEPVKRPSLKGEASLRLKFGSKEKGNVFVRRQVGVGSDLLTLQEAVSATATRPLVDYLDLTLPSFNPANVTKITFNRGPVKYEIEKDRGDPNSGVWKILKPADLAVRASDTEKINRIVFSLMGLQAVKLVSRKAADAELQRFGLKPPKTEAVVTIKDEKEPHVYQLGNETDDKLHYYAKLTGSDRIIQVAKAALSELTDAGLSDPNIWRLDPQKVLGIKFSGWKNLPGAKVQLLDLVRKSPTEWTSKDQPALVVDVAKAEAFAASLNIVRADHFIKLTGGPDPTHQLDIQAGALTLEVSIAGEKESFTLTIGAEIKREKTDYYYAISNRVPGAVFLVFKERFAELRSKGPNYLQKAK